MLAEAWERVRADRGAAGVDRIILGAVEEYGVDRMLRELRCDLESGVYRPAPVRRVQIPKPDGRSRPLVLLSLPGPYVGSAVGTDADCPLLPAPLASRRSMKRARARIKDLTDRRRVGLELTEVIAAVNAFLRGWGNYFRTGNAADQFVSLDRHVAWRLKRLLIKKRGRNLRSGQANQCTRTWFHDQWLYQLMVTIRYPKPA